MAKKLNKYDTQHLRNLGLTDRQITQIYDEAVKEAAAIAATVHDFDPDKPFSFDDYPITKARVDKMIKGLQKQVETAVVNGVDSAWTLANNKNSVLCDYVFGDNKDKLTKEQERRYYSNNDEARQAFLKRKTAGLNLSDRVWNYTNQFKTEIEMGLDLGIRNGTSANEMARDLKQYLKYPDKLFRRVRDEHGILHLSKAAKAFHPGRGVYRSSFRNARRLAATETNMAYRTSDHERWQQLDFVVGIEVRLSNNHTLNGVAFTDICDDLAGKYPKSFKFTGWHPLCRCHVVSILKTEEELMRENEDLLNGIEPGTHSVNEVKDVPDKFKEWIVDNGERIEKAEKRGTLPYFIKDNKDYVEEVRQAAAVRNAEKARQAELARQAEAAAKQAPKTLADYKHIPTLENTQSLIDEYYKNKSGFDELWKPGNEEKMREIMKELFENSDFGMNINASNLDAILNTHFKNQMETKTSNGALDIDLRKQASKDLFGTMEKTKPEDYEKYGYLMDRDILKNFNSNRDSKGAGQYGDTQIRFKKDRVVATFTMTDSLDAREDGRLLIPSLTTDPKLSSFDETNRLFKEMSRGKTMTKSATDFTDDYANGYIELQYHGRLDASAIESIFIPEKEFQQINKANLKAFKDKYGFKVFTEENDKLKEMF